MRGLALWMTALSVARCNPHDTPAPLEPIVELSSEAIGTAVFRWQAEGTHRVEFGIDALDRHSDDVTGEAWIQVTGFRAGETYRWRAVTETPDGVRVSSERHLAVPATSAPQWVITASDPERSELGSGAVLTSVLGPTGSWTGMVDGDGRWVWILHHDAQVIANDPQIALDGRSLLALVLDAEQDEDRGAIVRYALDGTVLEDFRAETLHHAVVERPGELVWLGFDFRWLTVDGEDWLVCTETLRRGDGSVWFDLFDDYGVDFYVPCSHTEAEVQRFGIPSVHEWTHGNSLVYVEPEDAWYLGLRFHDALLRIDGDGTRRWLMGGTSDEWTFEPGAAWSHAHFSEVWPGGMVLFDNGTHRRPEVSRALEVAWDEASHTVRRVWEFPHPTGGYASVLGDVKILPKGNRLVAWGDLNEITEVTPEGQIVFDALLPQHALGRIEFVPLPLTVGLTAP